MMKTGFRTFVGRNRCRNLSAVGAMLAVILCPTRAMACAMCMGASDAPIAPAVNASIFLLLGVVACVGASFFCFLYYLARCDGLALTPDQELQGLGGSPGDARPASDAL